MTNGKRYNFQDFYAFILRGIYLLLPIQKSSEVI